MAEKPPTSNDVERQNSIASAVAAAAAGLANEDDAAVLGAYTTHDTDLPLLSPFPHPFSHLPEKKRKYTKIEEERNIQKSYEEPQANHHQHSIAKLGYKQELRRNFGIIEVFGIAFSIMGLLPSIASTLAYSLPAGPAGLVWVRCPLVKCRHTHLYTHGFMGI